MIGTINNYILIFMLSCIKFKKNDVHIFLKYNFKTSIICK